MRLRRADRFDRASAAAADLDLPPAVFKTAPWQPRELVVILCTARYSAFGQRAYGRFLHHHPEGGAPDAVAARAGCADEQLRRTVIAWSLVGASREQCVRWDLDQRVGVETPWGVDPARDATIEADLATYRW